MSDEHAFKFDKLIATAKRLGKTDLYKVTLTGNGSTFTTFMHAENHATAAHNVIDELLVAARHPRAFRVRRMHEIDEMRADSAAPNPGDMIDKMNEALAYAERQKAALEKAEEALSEGRARRLGSCES